MLQYLQKLTWTSHPLYPHPSVGVPNPRPAYKELYNTSQLHLTQAESTVVKQQAEIAALTEQNQTLHRTVANLHGFLNSLGGTKDGVDVVQLLREKDYQNWKAEEEIRMLKAQLATHRLRLVQAEYESRPGLPEEEMKVKKEHLKEKKGK